MVEPHTPTSFKDPKSPILDAFSVDDKVAKTRELFGEMKQSLCNNEYVFDELHDRTAQTASLAGPVGTNSEVADLRQRLSDQDQKHKDVVTEIHGILDELELLQSQYVANVRKEVEREIAEQMDRLVKERVAECLKAHIAQELQNEVARSNRDSPQHQFLPGSELLHTELPMSPRNPPSALQGPSTPTLSHTITSPVDPPHLFALAHSSNSLSFTSPPPTLSISSVSGANRVDAGSPRFVPRAAAKLTVKKADGTEVSLENLTKSIPTPTTPAVSSSQSLELGQGTPGTPNRRPTSIHMETEDRHKSRLAEQEQNDRLKTEAADKKEKEKAEAERKAKVAEEIVKLEEAARLKKQEKKQRRKEQKEVKTEKALRLAQERAKVAKERKEKEKREEQERLSKLAAEFEGHKGDGKRDGQLEGGKVVDNETSMSMEGGKDTPKDGHRIRVNTISINSPTSSKPCPLDLTLARSASRAVAPLAAARFITNIAAVPYPEGYHGPHPDLNQDVKNGKSRYDREFLLQFMPICKERPPTLPLLDAIGLEPVHHTHKMSRGGPGLG